MLNKTKRQSIHVNNLLSSSANLLFFLIIFGACILLYSIYKLDRYIIIRKIDGTVYGDATLIYEDVGRYNGNINITKRYYWVDAEINLVRDYYNNFLSPLLQSEDEYGYWLMTLYNPNDYSKYLDALENVNTILGHTSFCPPSTSNNCITLSLVDTTQENYYQIATISPDFRWSSLPFDTPTSEGTLIIYTYYEGSL